MSNSEREMRFLETVEVNSRLTRAEIGTTFTEDIKKIEDIQSELRRKYRPSTMEVHPETLSMVLDDEVILTRPISVWEMIWFHGDANIKPPEFHPVHRDLVPTHHMEEYKVVNFGEKK